MKTILIIAIFCGSVCFTYGAITTAKPAATDYCSTDLCENADHIACDNDGVRFFQF